MAGTGVGKFSSTAGSNTSNLTVNFAENMAPSNVNNAARELMGHIRDMYEQLGDGYFEFGDGDGEYTVARSDADTITITSSSDISSVYFAGRKIRITDGGANVVEGTIASSSHTSTTQTVNLTGISLASGTPTKVELGVDTAAFGGRLILDDDGDTYIEAPTDDTIDIYVAGAKDFVITANTFTAESGSTITGPTVVGSTSIQTPLIEFTDGDDAITIADGGGVTFPIASTFTLGFTSNAASTITTTGNENSLSLISTDADANSGPILRLARQSASPADGDSLGAIQWQALDDGAGNNNMVQLIGELTDASAGSEDATLYHYQTIAGATVLTIKYAPTEIVFNDGSVDLDFRVESNGNQHMLFVDGNNDHVNIGTSTAYAGKLNIETTDNSFNLFLVSTDADANAGPNMKFYRNSSSPADSDITGNIHFTGRNDNSQDVDYAQIETLIADASDGTEDGYMNIYVAHAGTQARSRIEMDNTEMAINEGGADLDFRVESDGNANMFVVDGGLNRVAIGTNDPDKNLHLQSAGATEMRIENSSNNVQMDVQALTGSASIRTVGSHPLTLQTAQTEGFRVDINQKLMSNGETAGNTGEGGLCLNQNANDDEIMTFKSSDVAHGITVQGQTDDFLHIQKVTGANGGVEFKTFSEDQFGAYFTCCATDANTTTSASASGPFIVQPHKKDGTGIGAFSDADSNLFLVANSSSINFLIKADGEIFSNQSATVGTYDTFEDAQLVRSLELSRGSTMTGLINSQFDKYIKYNHETLAEANLVGRDKDGTPNHMVNITGMQRLHNGAIWQQYEKTQRLVNAVYELAKVAVGEEKANEILKQNEIKLLN